MSSFPKCNGYRGMEKLEMYAQPTRTQNKCHNKNISRNYFMECSESINSKTVKLLEST